MILARSGCSASSGALTLSAPAPWGSSAGGGDVFGTDRRRRPLQIFLRAEEAVVDIAAEVLARLDQLVDQNRRLVEQNRRVIELLDRLASRLPAGVVER